MNAIILYLIGIILTNVITAATEPAQILGLIVPYGTLFMTLTFVCRSLTQIKYGKGKTYIVIGSAIIISAVTSYLLGDTLFIVFASTVAFIVSGLINNEFFFKIKGDNEKKALLSSILGGAIDSIIFIVLGLSPIGAGFVTWSELPYAIAGQVIAKIIMQVIGYLILKIQDAKQCQETQSVGIDFVRKMVDEHEEKRKG